MERQEFDAIISDIRKAFYAMRNGMIADTLRKAGLEQKYIFGLQLPQIKEIVERYRPNGPTQQADLARVLWADRECREARLAACHLMPPFLMEAREAQEWAKGVATREEADILAFRLLQHTPFSADIAGELAASSDPLMNYTASAIRRFI